MADLTYVRPWAGMVYSAFILDAFSRRILGSRASTTLHTDLTVVALEMALWTRRKEDLEGVIHHSDRRVQYLFIRLTERLAEAGAVTSLESRGDSHANAPAETIIGLLQDGTHPKARSLEDTRRRGIRHARMGRLVQSPPAP